MKQSEALITESMINNQFFAAHIGAYVAYAQPFTTNHCEYCVTIYRIGNDEELFVDRINDIEMAKRANDIAWLIIRIVSLEKKAKDEA